MLQLAQHRVAVAIVAAAYAAVGAVFLLARPEYHRPAQGKALVFPEAPAPARGWSWLDGTPGFHFGDHGGSWNISRLEPSEVATARKAARSAGVAPASLGVLQVSRTRLKGRPQVLLAGADASGRTCIGAQPHRGPASFTCPPKLDGKIAIVLAEASPRYKDSYGMFLTGVVRADVMRVTVKAPGSSYADARGAEPVVRELGAQTVYRRGTPSWWGTFVGTTGQPSHWHVHIVFHGANGPVAATDLRFRRGGERMVAVAG